MKTVSTSPHDCLTKHRRALFMLSCILYRKLFPPCVEVDESKALFRVQEFLSLSRDKRVLNVATWYTRNTKEFNVSPSNWKHLQNKEETSAKMFQITEIYNTKFAVSNITRRSHSNSLSSKSHIKSIIFTISKKNPETAVQSFPKLRSIHSGPTHYHVTP